MNRKTITVYALLLLLTATAIGAYAGTIGVNDLFGFTNGYGFTWINSTNIDVTDYYRGGDNYTATIETLIAASSGLNPFDQSLNTTDAVTFDTVTSGEYFLNAVNITETVYTSQGATTTVGFNLGLDYLPNYWYCDGAADDVQIQAAINYVDGIGGGNIFLEAGSYDITATITLQEDMDIYGTGETTLLTLANGANADLFFADTKNNIGLYNIHFNGNGVNQGAASDVVDFTTCNVVTIQNCKIHNGYKFGIQLQRCNDVKILDNTIYANGQSGTSGSGIELFKSNRVQISNNEIYGDVYSYGVWVRGTNGDESHYVQITDNVIYSNNWDNVLLYFSDYCTVSSNTIYSSVDKSGIELENSDFCIVSNNNVGLNDDHGIELHTSVKCTVIGNTVYSNVIHGIILHTGSHDCIVADNICRDNDSGTANSYSGIRLTDANRNTITENHLSGNDANGIEISDGDNNYLVDNYCYNNTDYGIHLSNANAVNTTVRTNLLLLNTLGSLLDGGTNTLLWQNTEYSQLGDVRTNAGNIEMYNSTAWIIIGP